PGVPREMKQMTTDTVLPYLEEKNGKTVIQSRVLKFFGAGESRLEHDLQDLIKNQDNPTIAPLAQKSGLTIRLTAKAETVRSEESTRLNSSHVSISYAVFCLKKKKHGKQRSSKVHRQREGTDRRERSAD